MFQPLIQPLIQPQPFKRSAHAGFVVGVFSVGLLTLACDGVPPSEDGGRVAIDAGLSDGGAVDGGGVDAGLINDAGASLDAGASEDGGLGLDAGLRFDGGPTDAGASLDAGRNDAGQTDAGAIVDAGSLVDAGAGVDAGANVDAGTANDAGQATDGGQSTPPMRFFVTSRATGCPGFCGGFCGYAFDDDNDDTPGSDCSSGSGNLGGLAGADAHCSTLAALAGAGDRTWRAYLSVTADPGAGIAAVDARDRIGDGPWHNAFGQLIATDVESLHALVDPSADQHQGGNGEYGRASNFLNLATAVTEDGAALVGLVSRPSGGDHDILTGSRLDGTAFGAGANMTCNNWSSASASFSVQVGHFDLDGRMDASNNGASWVSAHPSPCSAAGLDATAGSGYLYCFAID